MRPQRTTVRVGNKSINMTIIPVCQWLSPIYWYYPSFIAYIYKFNICRILSCKYIDFLLLTNIDYKKLGNGLSTYKSERQKFIHSANIY